MTYVLHFSLTTIISLILFTCLLKVSSRIKQIQDQGISILGGAGVLCYCAVSLIYTHLKHLPLPPALINILLFASIIFLMGFIDDIREFPLFLKLTIQIIAISLFLLGAKKIQLYFLPGYINYLISFLWLLGITNAFNLLDINDGLCGGISLIISLAFAIISFLCGYVILTHLFICLSAALFAFYIFNLPPAKIYLGNSGSHFLGFLFASLSIDIDYKITEGIYTIFTPLLILAFPLLDTFFLIFARTKKGILPLLKSKDHIFMRLLKKDISHQRALFIIYLVTISWCTTGIFMLTGQETITICLLILSILMTIFTIKKARR